MKPSTKINTIGFKSSDNKYMTRDLLSKTSIPLAHMKNIILLIFIFFSLSSTNSAELTSSQNIEKYNVSSVPQKKQDFQQELGKHSNDVLKIQQIGVIKGSDIPANCAFSKLLGFQYKPNKLYAVLRITNIDDITNSVYSANMPFDYMNGTSYKYHDYFFPRIEFEPTETICFFIEIAPNSPTVKIWTFKEEFLVQLAQNAPLLEWNSVSKADPTTISLKICQKIGEYLYAGAEISSESEVLLQTSIESLSEAPVEIQFQTSASPKFIEESLLNTETSVVSLGTEGIKNRLLNNGNTFLLLPGERVISKRFNLYKQIEGGKSIMSIERNEILNKKIRAKLGSEIYSPPIEIY